MIIYIIVALIIGVLNIFNKMVNVKSSEYLGNVNGALINYFEATIISFVIVMATGNYNELSLSYIKEVPSYLYLGSIAGVLALILLVIGTKKTNVMVSTILVLVGQLITSIILDRVLLGREVSIFKILGIVLVIAGMTLREKTIKRA